MRPRACARHAGRCPVARASSCAACTCRVSRRWCIHRTRGPPAADVGRRGASPACNSAQVCATTQPILLPIRCSGASRVATALRRTVRRHNRHGRPFVAAAYNVMQQRSAGSCDDATDTGSSQLQQRISCCNSAQCDIAELLPERAVCCNGAPHVATAYDSVAEQVDAPLVAARCNGAACCNACCSAVQPAVAQPNLLRKAQ